MDINNATYISAMGFITCGNSQVFEFDGQPFTLDNVLCTLYQPERDAAPEATWWIELRYLYTQSPGKPHAGDRKSYQRFSQHATETDALERCKATVPQVVALAMNAGQPLPVEWLEVRGGARTLLTLSERVDWMHVILPSPAVRA